MHDAPSFTHEEFLKAIEETKDIPYETDDPEGEYVQHLVDTGDLDGLRNFFGYPVHITVRK